MVSENDFLYFIFYLILDPVFVAQCHVNLQNKYISFKLIHFGDKIYLTLYPQLNQHHNPPELWKRYLDFPSIIHLTIFFLRILGPPPSSDDLEASPKKSAPVSLMSLNVEMPETSEETIAPQTRDRKKYLVKLQGVV